jgi:hypothetical protein
MKIKIEEIEEEDVVEKTKIELFPDIIASIFVVILICVILFKGEPDIWDSFWKNYEWWLML